MLAPVGLHRVIPQKSEHFMATTAKIPDKKKIFFSLCFFILEILGLFIRGGALGYGKTYLDISFFNGEWISSE
jgi:hypothetical protein